MKIDVITVKLTVHIPVDRDNGESAERAYDRAHDLEVFASKLGQTTMVKRLNRVTAPEPTLNPTPNPEAMPDPDPVLSGDGLGDIPEHLRRTAEPKAAE